MAFSPWALWGHTPPPKHLLCPSSQSWPRGPCSVPLSVLAASLHPLLSDSCLRWSSRGSTTIIIVIPYFIGNFTHLFNCAIIFTGIRTHLLVPWLQSHAGFEWPAFKHFFPIDLVGLVCDFAGCEAFSETVIYCVLAETPVLKKSK